VTTTGEGHKKAAQVNVIPKLGEPVTAVLPAPARHQSGSEWCGRGTRRSGR
jgi:hypothetical protein